MFKNGSKKIMVVDDNEDVIFMLRSVLERDGYKIIEASSGEDCLSKVYAARPDLIIMDIMMPGMDGWEACRKIKESGIYSGPVSMLSVKKDHDDIKKSFEYAHADAHLKKPVDFDDLRRTVSNLIA